MSRLSWAKKQEKEKKYNASSFFLILQPCDFFSKRWQVDEIQNLRINTRLVTCGVVLPPWDSRAALQIYMDPTVPLYHIKNFMLELQKNAPGLHPSAVPSFAGY